MPNTLTPNAMSDLHSVNDRSRQPCLRRLDHVICEVPDIERALDRLHQGLGFPVAWPIGRYWNWGLTCGVALGGINLELLQPDGPARPGARIRRLVFEPTLLEEARIGFDRIGIPYKIQEKVERDSELLRLRGYSESEVEIGQRICTNLFPDRRRIAWDYFICEYAPTLARRLAPNAFRPPVRVTGIVCGATRGGRIVVEELSALGLEGGVDLSFRDWETDEVLEIRTTAGPLDLTDLEPTFRFT